MATEEPFVTAIRECLPERITFMDGQLLLVGEAACLAPPWAGVAVNQAAVSAFQLSRVLGGEIGIDKWEREVLASGRKHAAMSQALGMGMLASPEFRVGDQVDEQADSQKTDLYITHNMSKH